MFNRGVVTIGSIVPTSIGVSTVRAKSVTVALPIVAV